MAKYPRRKPARLTEKLRQIRNTLGLSQSGMVRRLGLSKELVRETISGFEIGRSEPSLPILLEYSRTAGVCLDVLIDDDLDLPEKLPSTAKHRPVNFRPAKRAGAKQ
jgi:transcriptional regulator with XRE-family HTH domain